MTSQQRPIGGCGDRLLVALRKSALLLHWVPGTGLQIVQPNRPTIRVTRSGAQPGFDGVQLTPCEFRGLVIGLDSADAAGLTPAIGLDPGNEVRLRHFTEDGTKLGGHGIVQFHPCAGTTAFAFPTVCADGDPHREHEDRSGTNGGDHGGRLRVAVDRDDALHASLVHVGYASNDTGLAQEVFSTVVSAAAWFAAAEVADTVENMAAQRRIT